MAAPIHQLHSRNVIPYVLVIRNILPYVLTTSTLGALFSFGGVWAAALPIA